GDVLDDDPKEATASGNQRPGLSIGQVAELMDCLPYALGQFLADHRRAVDGARNGGDGNPGQRGDAAYVRTSSGWFAGCFSRHEAVPKSDLNADPMLTQESRGVASLAGPQKF